MIFSKTAQAGTGTGASVGLGRSTLKTVDMVKGPQDLPLSARVADGAFRGFSIGTLWVAWFGLNEARAVGLEKGILQFGYKFGRFAVLTPVGFASFFAAYNAVLCGAEKNFGQGVIGPAFAGAMAGASVGSFVQPLRAVNVVGCAASTALVCVGFHSLLNGEKQ